MNEQLEFTYNLGTQFKIAPQEAKARRAKASQEEANAKFEEIKQKMDAKMEAKNKPQVQEGEGSGTPAHEMSQKVKGASAVVEQSQDLDEDQIKDEVDEEPNYEEEFD